MIIPAAKVDQPRLSDASPASLCETARVDVEPLPILAFGGKPPIRLWVAHGLHCAVYWGYCSFNGYIQLPPGHVDREFAEAYNEVKREDFETNPDPHRIIDRFIPSGYDVVDVPAHGGLTYGPDDQGWVGFDTGHAWDDWPDEEIEKWLRPVDEEQWFAFREMQLVVGPDSWPPGRLTRRYSPDLSAQPWSMELLIAETEAVAERLAAMARTAE